MRFLKLKYDINIINMEMKKINTRYKKQNLMERLVALRQESGLTQQIVAYDLGITTSAYANYEQGLREPSIETLVKMSDLFDVTVDYLLGLTDEY